MRAAFKEPHFPSPTKNLAARYLRGLFFFLGCEKKQGPGWCLLAGVLSLVSPSPVSPSLVSPHWCPSHLCPLTGAPSRVSATGVSPGGPCWWPRDRPPDAHSQVHTLIPELTPEAGLRPRAPELLIQVLGTPGVTMAQPQACQEASHLKAHCPLTGSCAIAVGWSMGVHGLSCWTKTERMAQDSGSS